MLLGTTLQFSCCANYSTKTVCFDVFILSSNWTSKLLKSVLIFPLFGGSYLILSYYSLFLKCYYRLLTHRFFNLIGMSFSSCSRGSTLLSNMYCGSHIAVTMSLYYFATDLSNPYCTFWKYNWSNLLQIFLAVNFQSQEHSYLVVEFLRYFSTKS